LALAAVALRKPWTELAKDLPAQNMLLNYVGPQNPVDTTLQSFRSTEFEGVALGQDAPRVYRNKIVLVVPAAVDYKDQFNTPFGQMYGGYVQANALNTILNRNPIVPAGPLGNALILLIVGLLATGIAAQFGIIRSTLGVILVAIVYAGFTIALFDYFNVWINLITPETAIVLSFAGIMALRFATEERKRRRTSKIFGQYVKPEIVDILVNAKDEEVALAGARRPVTVLFVDIRGFTAMSEHMNPEDVVSALDIYLEELTVSVQDLNGTIDKYVGDELMAIWNAPGYQENHPLLAVKCALDMIDRIDRINRQLLAKGLPAIRYGIGVNTGEVVVGQMGSSLRKQYTVIGDTVNTAARLCSAAGGGEIIIGEETWEAIGDQLVVEETEPLPLKGKSKRFRTFVVLALREETVASPEPVPAPA
jgi:adenylate cyclase